MSNLEIREFTQAIINFINQSPLPVEVKRLALADISSQIDSAANNAIQVELAERARLTETEERKETEEQKNGNE